MAEREGFEPSVPPFSSTRDFQSRSFSQLGHLSATQFCKIFNQYFQLYHKQ